MKADNEFNTPWRQTAAVIYKAPKESRIWGSCDADVTNVMDYLLKKKEEGVPLTLTQYVAAAIGRSYKNDVPELNCYVKRGNIYPRKDVRVFVSVEIPSSKEMSGFSIPDAGNKTVYDIHHFMKDKVENYRKKKEAGVVKNKYMLTKFPWPVRSWIAGIIKFCTTNLGISLKPIKVDPDSFGNVLLSNIGSHGLDYGMAALLPVSNVPVVLLTGVVRKKPVVIDGEIVIRDIMPMSATLDHRLCDAGSGGRLAKALQKYFDNPRLLETV